MPTPPLASRVWPGLGSATVRRPRGFPNVCEEHRPCLVDVAPDARQPAPTTPVASRSCRWIRLSVTAAARAARSFSPSCAEFLASGGFQWYSRSRAPWPRRGRRLRAAPIQWPIRPIPRSGGRFAVDLAAGLDANGQAGRLHLGHRRRPHRQLPSRVPGNRVAGLVGPDGRHRLVTRPLPVGRNHVAGHAPARPGHRRSGGTRRRSARV